MTAHTLSDWLVRMMNATRIPSWLDSYSLAHLEEESGDILILLYHRVSPASKVWELPPINPEVFDMQMRLVRQRYQPITMEECVAHLNGTKLLLPCGRRYIVVTFDDGYKDNYQYAYPILKKYNIPATFYITTGLVNGVCVIWTTMVNYLIHQSAKKEFLLEGVRFDISSIYKKQVAARTLIEKFGTASIVKRDQMLKQLRAECEVQDSPDGKQMFMSMEEVTIMASDPLCAIGAHTFTHPNLATLSTAELKLEIEEPLRQLNEILGKDISTLAYPFGQSSDISNLVIEAVKKAGFSNAVTTLHGFNNTGTDLFLLRRITAPYTLSKFQLKISKFYSWFIHRPSI